jgi:hypothetical protein
MTSVRTVLLSGLLLGLGPAALSQTSPTSGRPMRVTTDTPEYCDDLAGRVEAASRAHPVAAAQVQSLASEGRQMCNIGLIRGGLARLRRALIVLQSEP